MYQLVKNCTNCEDLICEMVSLQSARADLEYSYTSSEEKLKALEQELEELTSTNESLQCQLDKSKCDLAMKAATNDVLERQVMEYYEKSTKSEAENKEMKKKIKELEALLKTS